MLMTADNHNRGLADPKQLRRRILDANTHWISRRQMHHLTYAAVRDSPFPVLSV
jgi:hypothetical protein